MGMAVCIIGEPTDCSPLLRYFVTGSGSVLVLGYEPSTIDPWVPCLTLSDWSRPHAGCEEWQVVRAANREIYRAFTISLAATKWYDPLPIIMRAVNSIRLRWHSKSAPRWRRGRWKSKA